MGAAQPVPLAVAELGDDRGGLTLHWRPNPQGQAPTAYKVYGSDERGFTASDSEYPVSRGKGFVRTMAEYEAKPAGAPDAGLVKTPANLIARVSSTSLRVVGAGLTAPNTNKAYYRVAAIDAAGNQSGPSDYVEVPRPFVLPPPPQAAKVGKSYHYQPRVIRSVGDLRCRRSRKSSYNAAFWDREEHTFAPVRLPAGLALDAKSGAVSGKPAKPGEFDVTFKVADQFGKSCTASYKLRVTR